MFDLKDLDLDIDEEDFPTGLFKKNNFFGSISSVQNTEVKNKRSCILRDENIVGNDENFLEVNGLQTPAASLFANKQPGNSGNETPVSESCSSNGTDRFLKAHILPRHDDDFSNSEHNSSKRMLTERKFPGPAGILPDKPLKHLTDLNLFVDVHFDGRAAKQQDGSLMLCTQTPVNSEPTFRQLLADFDMNESNCPVNKYTIDWVKKKSLKKILCGKKIPFLAVVLHHLDHSTPDPILTLRDATGDMYGTLHREVWAKLGEKLHPGAALALRQVGVVITGITRRQVYLNITINNIVNIYSFSEENGIEVDVINKATKEELARNIDEWQLKTPSVQQSTPAQLFTEIGSELNNLNSSFSKMNSSVKTYNLTSKRSPNKHLNQSQSSSLCSSRIKNSTPIKNSVQINNTVAEYSFTSNSDTSLDESFFGIYMRGDQNNESHKVIKNADTIERSKTLKFQSDIGTHIRENTPHFVECEIRNDINRKRKLNPETVGASSQHVNVKHSKKICDNNNSAEIVTSIKTTVNRNQVLSEEERLIIEESVKGIEFDDFDDF